MNATDYQTAAARKGDWMQTYSGIDFWPLDPHAEDVNIVDIAHALSQQCRFAGHTTRFYSVAEHCCYIHDHAPIDQRQWGLLHDASEAYLTDVIRPIKPYLHGYTEIEEAIMRVIATKYSLVWPMPMQIKRLDNAILANERDQVMSEPPRNWNLSYPAIPGLVINGWNPDRARGEFLARYYQSPEWPYTDSNARVDTKPLITIAACDPDDPQIAADLAEIASWDQWTDEEARRQ